MVIANEKKTTEMTQSTKSSSKMKQSTRFSMKMKQLTRSSSKMKLCSKPLSLKIEVEEDGAQSEVNQMMQLVGCSIEVQI